MEPGYILGIVIIVMVLVFKSLPYILRKRKIRCSECGLNATFVGQDDLCGAGVYIQDVYRCPNGHETSP